MSRNYQFNNPVGVYFVGFAVVAWFDFFIRNEYKNILLDSLHYYQQEQGMEIFAWCITTRFGGTTMGLLNYGAIK